MSQLYITISEEFVKDKPLPEGYFWYLKEDDHRFASIRSGSRLDMETTNLVRALQRDQYQKQILFLRATHEGNKAFSSIEDGPDAIEEAVNFMYADFILGEQST